ncbi:hypothetical protein ACKFKG_05505 [Phormidesmis sp. 146-35]
MDINGIAELWDELPQSGGKPKVQSPPILGDLGGEKLDTSHAFIPPISNADINIPWFVLDL